MLSFFKIFNCLSVFACFCNIVLYIIMLCNMLCNCSCCIFYTSYFFVFGCNLIVILFLTIVYFQYFDKADELSYWEFICIWYLAFTVVFTIHTKYRNIYNISDISVQFCIKINIVQQIFIRSICFSYKNSEWNNTM